MTGSSETRQARAQLSLAPNDERPEPGTWEALTPAGNGPVFARHGTFHPRSGWLKKGFDAAVRDAYVFAREDAPVVLGVGKNMVRAIRYWCHAFGLLREGDGGRDGGSCATEFGERLMGPRGFDPYLEDLGSLWLLHWALLREGGLATAWRFAFFEYPRPEFTADELTDALTEYTHREFPGVRSAAASSLRKDAACLTRMYGDLGGGEREPLTSEETLRCPFVALGLLQPAVLRRAFAFHVGPKPGLSGDLVAAACLEYMAARPHASRTVSVATLARGAGAPGLAFRLGEGALYAALETAAAVEPTLTLADAGGVVQLAVQGGPDRPDVRALAARCVDRHYAKVGRVSSDAPAGGAPGGPGAWGGAGEPTPSTRASGDVVPSRLALA